MTSRPPTDDERPVLEREDERLLARVRDAWSPEPLGTIERAAFDARLQERIARRRHRLGPWPALGAGLVAASLAVLLLVREDATGPPAPRPPPTAAREARPAARASAASLLYGGDDELDANDDALPAEYAAIASVFLDRAEDR